MDLRTLLENRRHGSPEFPVGIYRMARAAGDPILDTHWHEEAEFLAVESGRAIFQVGASTYEVREGEALFIPGGELHGGHAWDDAPCTYAAVVFDPAWLRGHGEGIPSNWYESLRKDRIRLPSHWTSETEWGRRAYLRLLELTALEAMEVRAKPLRVRGLLDLLVAEFVDAGAVLPRNPDEDARDRTPERIKQALTFIESQHARKLTIGDMADAAGMSEGHFSRTFKQYLRKTPIEYLNDYRLRRAAELLLQPGSTVAEAAMECGFDNFSYFSKLFRSRYQRTPSAYRKS